MVNIELCNILFCFPVNVKPVSNWSYLEMRKKKGDREEEKWRVGEERKRDRDRNKWIDGWIDRQTDRCIGRYKETYKKMLIEIATKTCQKEKCLRTRYSGVHRMRNFW